MLNGVIVKELKTFPDDRGDFTEILKEGEAAWQQFKQASVTHTYPGVVKAFHWHKRQFDLWYCAAGNIQAVLYDQRADSPTHKQTQVVYMGERAPVAVLIPPGVVHGYRVLGPKCATVIYFTTEAYDPKDPDEERLPFDDSTIGFDWTTKNK